MQTTLGIDLASQPRNTAMCVVGWSEGSAEVLALAKSSWAGTPLHDKLLSTSARGLWGFDAGWGEGGRPVKVGIDAPFGWPEPFVKALQAHDALEPWPEILDNPRARFERRETDRYVHQRTGKLPLSVSTDRIAFPAMRCAVLLGDLSQHLDASELARDGSGCVAEVYPDAALRAWLPNEWSARGRDTYKGSSETAHQRRERLIDALLAELGSALKLAPADREACLASDDCLDAFVCALVARAVDRGLTELPEAGQQSHLANAEGWIHLPRPGSLSELLTAL